MIKEFHYFSAFYGTENEIRFDTFEEAEQYEKSCFTFGSNYIFYDASQSALAPQTEEEKDFLGARKYYDQAKYLKVISTSLKDLKDEARQTLTFLGVHLPLTPGNYIYSNSNGWIETDENLS